MRFGPEVYSLDFFREKGYVRKKCKVCGEYFWTLDPEREVCGESPCEAYRFVGRNLAKKRMNVRESRETFLRFFEKRGHRVIKPYPVVARWRTDMFLTDASIVDFQPYVTSGIAPPPANPLVISQPCIRLVDVDKVGLTFGRHLTIFEMGGAHAFNYPDKEVYWKEETVAYYHEFASREIGIPEKEIIYKESVWSGGGNAGPCFETISYGLELATLVFMQYKTVDSELVELPIRTVDTGYGIERFAWFSQGTPSSFDAIYGEIYPRVSKVMEIPKAEKELLEKYSPYTALVVPKAGMTVAEARRRVAEASGIPLEVIVEKIEPLEKFYAALDFTKSITFIISEGVVPSNVRVGYLARLLIRKAYRLLQSMGYQDRLLDLIDIQVDYWGRDFPHLREMRDETLDIIASEIEKFEETIRKGASYVERELKELRSRGVEEVPVDFMVRVYDERGVTPDLTAQVAERLGMRVKVPENFYELVASRHLRAEAKQEDELTKRLEERFRGLPATRKTYYEKPFESRFRARVLDAADGYVVLDQTLFYPEGGGQVADTGTLRWDGSEARVVDVQVLGGGIIVHKIEGEMPGKGVEVEGEVDYWRRLSIMRHHTATHILLGAARRVLGKHAWQAGAKKEPDKARLDIHHHRRLSPEDVRRLEEEANKVVSRRIPVKIAWMNRNEAEARYGFSLYQGGEVPSADIRVVEIPGWDAEACGGLHVENTEDVGLIKIVRVERIQEGVERLIFTAGAATLPYIQEEERLLRSVSEKLETPVDAVEKKLDELLEEIRESRRLLRRLKTSAAKLRAQELAKTPLKASGITLYVSTEPDGDQEYALTITDNLLGGPEPACAVIAFGRGRQRLVAVANEAALGKGLDAGRLARLVAKELGGGGGGKKRLGQAGLPREVSAEELRRIVLEKLGEALV